ncbi:MAG: hypothetical protein AAB383_03695 [Patescibacteria group bacterium]
MKLLPLAFFSLVLLSACSSDQANQDNAMSQEGEPIPETTLMHYE